MFCIEFGSEIHRQGFHGTAGDARCVATFYRTNAGFEGISVNNGVRATTRTISLFRLLMGSFAMASSMLATDHTRAGEQSASSAVLTDVEAWSRMPAATQGTNETLPVW